MSYVMINATNERAKIDAPIENKSKYDGKFIIRNYLQELSIKSGDHFASFYNKKKDIKMLNKGLVKSVRVSLTTDYTQTEYKLRQRIIDQGKIPSSVFIHEIDFVETTNFHNYVFLDDYTYSLLKIYKRYLNPVKHFSNTVTDLPKVDFDTLDNERVFVDRTLFGRLINALPYENRLQFLLYSIDYFQEPDLTKVPFSEAFPLLKDFVESGIIKMGKYMIKAQELIRDNQDVFKGNLDFIFIDNNDRRYQTYNDSLNEQAELFKSLFETSDNFNLMFSRDEVNGENELFNSIFNRRAWPVDLNRE